MRRGDFLESAYLDSVQQIPMGVPLKTKAKGDLSFLNSFFKIVDVHITVLPLCVCLGDSPFQLFIQTTSYHKPSFTSHNATGGHPNTLLFNSPQLAITTVGNNNMRYPRT